MVKLVQGNLLEADVDDFVDAVKPVRVKGKGIALPFNEAFVALRRVRR